MKRIAAAESSMAITFSWSCSAADSPGPAPSSNGEFFPFAHAMLIETHAHLDYPDFVNDFDDVLRRATDAGVTRIITIGTSVESSRRAVGLAEKYPNIFAVIGVHPTYVEESGEDVITPLRELAQNPCVVAIGETGLDYHSLPSKELEDRKAKTFPHQEVFHSVAKALQFSTEDQIEAQIHDGAYKSKQTSLFEQQ